jgi:hypothetical protein
MFISIAEPVCCLFRRRDLDRRETRNRVNLKSPNQKASRDPNPISQLNGNIKLEKSPGPPEFEMIGRSTLFRPNLDPGNPSIVLCYTHAHV